MKRILIFASIVTAGIGLAINFFLGVAIYETWTYDRGPLFVLAVILIILMTMAISMLGHLIARLTIGRER